MTNQEEVYMSKLANSQMVKVCVCVCTCVFMRACVSVHACGFCVPRAYVFAFFVCTRVCVSRGIVGHCVADVKFP